MSRGATGERTDVHVGGWRARRGAVLAILVVAVVVACAQQGAPPGGPPDAELPVLLRSVPESNAVNVRAPAVVLQFDEVISERSAGTGGQVSPSSNTLASVLVISPSDGREEVLWRRTTLELRPRRGFRPNTTYRVTINPGLADLRGNRTTEGFDFVFSTGPTTARGELSGVFFDWTTGKAAPNARIEVFRADDSTFRWTARSDSSGRFRVRDLAAGPYELRAWLDGNNDRRISFREVSDVAQITLADTASVELYAFVRDTLPPRLETIEVLDSTGIRVRFDRGIVHDWDGSGVTLLGVDSTIVGVAGPMQVSARFDSTLKTRRAASDSAARAEADSARAATDSTRPPVTDTAVAERAPAGPPRAPVVTAPPAATAATASSAADTLPPPVFKRRVPEVSWTLPLRGPLEPGSYRLIIRGAPGLNGRVVESDREFRVRAPEAPTAADSSRRPAARDSSARPAPRRRP